MGIIQRAFPDVFPVRRAEYAEAAGGASDPDAVRVPQHHEHGACRTERAEHFAASGTRSALRPVVRVVTHVGPVRIEDAEHVRVLPAGQSVMRLAPRPDHATVFVKCEHQCLF